MKTIKPATYKAWEKLAQKELRDRPIKSLEKDYGGINVRPAYFADDVPEAVATESPGVAPYTRGVRASMYANRPWTIRQYAGFSTAKESNQFYRKNLAAGQKGLSVAFDLATHRGYDSDHARVKGDVGKAGVAIDSIEDMKVLFNGIPLDKMSVSMTMNGAVIPVMAMFIGAAREQGVSAEQLSGTIQNDVLKEFMVRNTYIYPPEPSMRIVGDVMEYAHENMPKFNSISISGYHMHEAGASAMQELAFTLGDGMEYVRAAQQRGLDIDEFAPRLSFFFGIGMNFFLEIAKLRAARQLWAKIMEDLGAKEQRSKMLRTHTQTSGVSLTEQDPQNNIVRTAFEAMAAVLGGTQSLHTNSFDEAIALPSDASARIARNTQLILTHETGITDIVDPLGGSYYVESLTAQLVAGAAKIIKQVEENGGMTKAVASGWPSRQIEKSAALRQTRIDKGEDVIVGVNRFVLEEESEFSTRQIDNDEVRKQQILGLKKVRKNRDNSAVQAALKTLTDCAQSGEGNLLDVAVDAAEKRATLGEISTAMEKAFGRYEGEAKIISGVFSQAYEGDAQYNILLERIKKYEKKHGRRPVIYIAKMGQDGHDRGAKIIATAFGDMGFVVNFGSLFETAHEVAKHLKNMQVDAVGISSLAAGHKTLVPELIDWMKAQGQDHIPVVVGGVIPRDDYQFLFDAGVAEIFGPGTNVLEAAFAVLNRIEGKETNL
ncbi:Methylmalonyl-CoA mutase / B12 binding domain of Methylmalonyl-CoA mutase [hydrothermal vent metagenome]|uniref:Methylmalonyl-CoA mutase / B12 binding domain of Methylmalonyl-CoA mutase n=1 Tax=hydrothermal vent metagenome TaxID=652676 RepID=A0A3B0U9Z1_9ZZZZ